MELTRAEENRYRVISGVATAIIFGLLLLFILLFTIVTPNPPFPEGGGGGGKELALGMMNLGNGDVDYSDMAKATDVVVQKEEPKEEILTDENGEPVPVEKKEEAKPEVKNNTTIIKPVVKPKEPVHEETAAEKLAKKFRKSTGKTGGGIGDNAEAGQNGAPDGDPFKNGTGGHGNGSGGGVGEGTGPGSGPGFGGGSGGGHTSFDLKGRAVVIKPKLPTDTKEEGKVVVEITVDKEGNVIDANPNGRGTTTSSALLKAKAKQAAMATKFNVSGKFEEQNGTITIIFSFD